MAKKLGFRDFLTVDYAPGMPDLIKKNAKKRKMADDAGSNAEYASRYAPDEQIDTIDEATPPGGEPLPALNPDQAHKWLDQGKHTKKLSMGWSTKNVTVKQERDTKNKQHHVHVHQYTEEVEEVEEALNPTQRRQRAMQMRRMQTKIAMGKERASKKFADPKRLMSRARKQARTMIFQKLTRGVPKSEINLTRRQEIEKRMDTPAMKKIVNRLALKLLSKERKLEIARHQQPSQAGDK